MRATHTNGGSSGAEVHRRLAVDLFNLVWDLLDQEDRAAGKGDRMIHAAHASRLHWGEVGGWLELVRGQRQASRVCAELDRPHASPYHGQRRLTLCQASEIGDFDLAYAW